jgi:hypothetical protein
MRLPLIAAPFIAAVALLGVAASSASASIITRTYPLLHTGFDATYGAVIYDPQDGTDPINLTGFPVINTHIKVDYVPAPGESIDNLVIQMLVPTIGSAQFLEIDGAALTALPSGHYTYDVNTTDYNGTIYGGRFSVSTFSLNALGDPTSTPGVWAADSGISLIVQTPEPVSTAAIGGGLLTLVRRRR